MKTRYFPAFLFSLILSSVIVANAADNVNVMDAASPRPATMAEAEQAVTTTVASARTIQIATFVIGLALAAAIVYTAVYWRRRRNSLRMYHNPNDVISPVAPNKRDPSQSGVTT